MPQLAIAARNLPILNASFLEWCEVEIERALEKDAMRTHESCWEQEPVWTLSLCLAFRGSQYRPMRLDQFHRMCAASDDLLQALADDEVDTTGVIEMALFPAPSDDDGMPAHLREACNRYRAHILEAAQGWGWIREVFDDQRAAAAARARCRCGGDCVCE